MVESVLLLGLLVIVYQGFQIVIGLLRRLIWGPSDVEILAAMEADTAYRMADAQRMFAEIRASRTDPRSPGLAGEVPGGERPPRLSRPTL